MRLDDFSAWQGASDRVMGGISRATVTLEERDNRRWLRLAGQVRLENQGGFIQMGVDLAPDGRPVDLSAFTGVRLLVRGNGERYGCHLRTTACVRPWQSYRAAFLARAEAATVELPFTSFVPHRVDVPLAPARCAGSPWSRSAVPSQPISPWPKPASIVLARARSRPGTAGSRARPRSARRTGRSGHARAARRACRSKSPRPARPLHG